MRRNVLLFGVSLAALPLAAQTPPARPPGVTDSSITAGRVLFHGAANCAGCHGEDAEGTRYAKALDGVIWRHGPGTYDWLVRQIKRGVPAHKSWTGTSMPMRGWSPLSDAEVEAVAAYVWSISHPPRAVRRPPKPTR